MDNMEQEARDFIEYAKANWGRRYPDLSDDDLSRLLSSRLASGDFSNNLWDDELRPFREKENLEFLAFKAEYSKKWLTHYPGMPSDAIEKILLVRWHTKDFSYKLSLQEQAPMLLAQKAEREARDKEWIEKLYPSKVAEEHWLSKRSRPSIQKYGISARGAEYLVADWLRFLGEASVQVTQEKNDGGIDVMTEDYGCQVKNYSKQNVTVSEVRDLFGAAVSFGKKPLLFTASGLSAEALAFSLSNSIPVIQFVAETGTLFHLNPAGEGFLHAGRYQDS
jgi:hypothetical protein